jgi:outer membrane protein TolC
MANSKRRAATEPVTHAAAEPSSDGRDSETARRAYDRYQQRGRVDGHDVDDWLAAERELELARNDPPD